MNDLSKVVDKLLAQGLLALRGTCVMPRLVNSDYSNLAAQQGASIDVPIPSAIKARPAKNHYFCRRQAPEGINSGRPCAEIRFTH